MMQLLERDAVDVLNTGILAGVKCIFLDPPDNTGLVYDGDFTDYRADYFPWLHQIIRQSMLAAKVVWLSFNPRWDFDITRIVDNATAKVDNFWWSARRIIWAYTFGQYNDKDFAYCYRPIFLLTAPDAKLYPDAIRVTSARMELGDKRAAGPRVPGDVWNFPRVVGNSKERQRWHPTQHPVALYDRVIKYSCGPGDTFVDLFAGSGTCFRAAALNPEVNVVGVEKSATYCDKLRELYFEQEVAV